MTHINRWLIPALLATVFGLLLYIVYGQSPSTGMTSGAPMAATENDGRVRVAVTPAQAAHVLGEMRVLMTTLRDMQMARTANDNAAFAAAAERASPKGAKPMAAEMQSVLPPEFRAMSKMMRGEFAEAAVQAKAGQMGAADEAVGRAMNACVACHEGYRLVGR